MHQNIQLIRIKVDRSKNLRAHRRPCGLFLCQLQWFRNPSFHMQCFPELECTVEWRTLSFSSPIAVSIHFLRRFHHWAIHVWPVGRSVTTGSISHSVGLTLSSSPSRRHQQLNQSVATNEFNWRSAPISTTTLTDYMSSLRRNVFLSERRSIKFIVRPNEAVSAASAAEWNSPAIHESVCIMLLFILLRLCGRT